MIHAQVAKTRAEEVITSAVFQKLVLNASSADLKNKTKFNDIKCKYIEYIEVFIFKCLLAQIFQLLWRIFQA
jgi:hypothetical protein